MWKFRSRGILYGRNQDVEYAVGKGSQVLQLDRDSTCEHEIENHCFQQTKEVKYQNRKEEHTGHYGSGD